MYYSVDFRKRVLEYASTYTIQKAAKVFGIGQSTVTRWRAMLKRTGSLKNAPLVRKLRKIDYVKLREIAEEFGCCKETIRQTLIKLGFTLKKRPKYTEKGMKRGERVIRKKI